MQAYLDYMDVALGALAKGNDRTALDDLYFLLGQFPGDVNAQFYAGLACYRLGLYPRAIRLLHAAADNTVDSFQEESLWYEALATTKQDGSRRTRQKTERGLVVRPSRKTRARAYVGAARLITPVYAGYGAKHGH